MPLTTTHLEWSWIFESEIPTPTSLYFIDEQPTVWMSFSDCLSEFTHVFILR